MNLVSSGDQLRLAEFEAVFRKPGSLMAKILASSFDFVSSIQPLIVESKIAVISRGSVFNLSASSKKLLSDKVVRTCLESEDHFKVALEKLVIVFVAI